MNVDLFLQSLKRHEGRLFGRDDEVHELRTTFRESVETKKPKAVFVHGYAGSGKSQLIQHALRNHTIKTKLATPLHDGSDGSNFSIVRHRRDLFARSNRRRRRGGAGGGSGGASSRSNFSQRSRNLLNSKGSLLNFGGSQTTHSTQDSSSFFGDSRISSGGFADSRISSLSQDDSMLQVPMISERNNLSSSTGSTGSLPMIGDVIEITIQEETSEDCNDDGDGDPESKSNPQSQTQSQQNHAASDAEEEIPNLIPMKDGSDQFDQIMDSAPDTILEEEEEEEDEEEEESPTNDTITTTTNAPAPAPPATPTAPTAPPAPTPTPTAFPSFRRQTTRERRRNAVAADVPATTSSTTRSSFASSSSSASFSSSFGASSTNSNNWKSWKPIFVEGKYDQQRSSRPYSALADACSMLCRSLDLNTTASDHDVVALNKYNNNRRLQRENNNNNIKKSPRAAVMNHQLVDQETVRDILVTLEKNLNQQDYSILFPIIPELANLVPSLAVAHQQEQQQQKTSQKSLVVQSPSSERSLVESQRSLQLNQILFEDPGEEEDHLDFNLNEGVRAGGKSWHDFDRLKDAIKTFLSSISKHTPVVLFLDDLQWADSASLEILSSLLPDTRINGPTYMLMVVGAYRDNELVLGLHPQTQAVRQLEAKHCSTKMHVTDLGLEPLNTFVASLLKYEDDPQITLPLTKSIHERTRGNAFFVIQFLQMLVTTEILRYSFLSMKWEWDKEKLLEQTNATENVTDLVITRMRRLPPKTALALIIASQLGNRFDGSLVKAVLDKWKDGVENLRSSLKNGLDESWNVSSFNLNVDLSESSMDIPEDLSFLDVPIAEGFIVPMDTFNNLSAGGDTWYRFLHDRIQQAAAGLIEDEHELKLLRLRLGTLLLDVHKKTENKRNWAVLSAVDLLNTTFDVVDENRRMDLVEANYQAAQIAAMQSAFVAAAWYLSQSRYLLQGYPDETIWEDNYKLAIHVYSMSAEMEYCCGNTSQCLELFEQVKQNHKQPKDSWLASYVAMKCLGSEAKYDECIEVAYQVLREAGFHMPKHSFDLRTERSVTQYDDVFSIYGKTMEALSKVTDLEILSLPEEQADETSSLVWRILASTVLFVWHSHRSLDFSYLCCSAFLRTLERGLGSYSGKAFALLGFCSLANQDYAVAQRMQKLWLHPEIVQRYAGKHSEASTLATAYVATGHAFIPVTKVADEFLKGYNAGMQSGSIEWAMASAASFLLSHFIGGLPLKMYERKSHIFIKEMKKYRNKIDRPLCEMYLQFAVNLMGKGGGKNGEALHVLQGEILDDYDMPRIIGSTHLQPGFPVHIAWFVQLMLSYYFEDYDTAAEMAMKHEDCGAQDWPMIWSVPQPYFRGLAYVEKVRSLKQRVTPMGVFSCGFSSTNKEIKAFTQRARKQLEMLKENASNGMINMVHQYKILEAEIASLTATRSSYEDVLNTYLEAIRSAARSGFRQDAALASEKAALFMMSRSNTKEKVDPSNASHHIHKSIELYEKWGATVKADNMKAKYSELGLYDPSQKRRHHRAHTESVVTRASSAKIYTDSTMSQQRVTLTSSIISMSTSMSTQLSTQMSTKSESLSNSSSNNGSSGASSRMRLGSTGSSSRSLRRLGGLSSRLLQRGKSSSRMNLGSEATTSTGHTLTTNASTNVSQLALESSSRMTLGGPSVSLGFSTDSRQIDSVRDVF